MTKYDNLYKRIKFIENMIKEKPHQKCMNESMNSQIEIEIMPDVANQEYDLNAICETADSTYWTLELPDEVHNMYYNVLVTDK